MSTTKQLTMGEVLEWYDGPLLFLTDDPDGNRHLCVVVENSPTQTTYLCSQLEPGMLASFLAGHVDLRSAILAAPYDAHWLATVTGTDSEGEWVVADKLDCIDSLPPHMLPSDGYFCKRGGAE